jgi:hypothetical protein
MIGLSINEDLKLEKERGRIEVPLEVIYNPTVI